MPTNNAQPTLAITQFVVNQGVYPPSDHPTGRRASATTPSA